MTATQDIATKLAAAVIDRIEADRCCNSDNIGNAILKELAVVALSAQPGMPSSDPVRMATEDLIRLVIREPSLTFNTPSKLDGALGRVYKALMADGWHP